MVHKTNKNILEQRKKKNSVEETPKEEAPEEEEEIPEEESPEAEEYGEEPPMDIVKILALKKIYARLLSISDLVDAFSDERFDDIKDKILEATDDFHIIVKHLDQFKDKLDSIISAYGKFLVICAEEIEKLSKNPKGDK